MNILVTGGAGFIGSNLVRKLLKNGHKVTIYDNFSIGHIDNIKGLDVEIIEDNIENFDAHDVSKIDVIIHLGMPSTMMLYRNEPVKCMREAIVGMNKILEECRKHGIKLIFASSSSVYNGLDEPHTEDREILVKDFYTEGRVAMERLAKLYSDLYGMHSIGFRFFAVYGPYEEKKQGYANMVSQFLWTIMKGEKPQVFGDGTQTRDFTNVDDVTRILIEAMDKKFDDTEIFNIGTAHNYNFNEIIKIINEELGTNIQPEYVPNPIRNYVHSLLADITKLKKHFNPPTIEIREGVRNLIEYYKTDSAPPEMQEMTKYYISKIKTKDPEEN
ncbi:NAD-dependent epimerase/dehydratase family protein [Patescibacteria group bacterium]|nr:NAD-dependent epimerase/dehydratase family protein [Patescibacteria group bacterium]